MSHPKLIIISSENIKAYTNLVMQDDWQWVFMGTDSCLREKIIEELDNEKRVCYANDFQQICIKQKNNFLDWINKIGTQYDISFWSATTISYKSPLATDLFLNYCFLSLIQKWNCQNVKKILIIIENPWLIKACSINFNNDSIQVIDNNFNYIKKWINLQFVSYAKLFFFFVRSLKVWILDKVYTLKYNKKIAHVLRNKIDVMTCTWIEDRSFSGKNGRFVDPYLGSLNDYYKTMGLNTATITLPILPDHILKKIYECEEIIPSIHFARLRDIFKVFSKCFSLEWNNKYIYSNGLQLTYLFEFETIAEKYNVYHALLHYQIYLRLFAHHKMQCHALIYPFENQPWDKMMILALRQFNTNCKAIGYQHSTISPFLLNYFLGKNENNIQPQPDVIVSNGEYWGAILKNGGFSCPIKNGGSLRFSSNIKPDKTEIKLLGNDRDNNVLVLLSSSLNYSLDLLFYLIKQPKNDKRFLLRPHPDTPETMIKRYIKKLPDNFIFVDGSMAENMSRVAWAIHVGTTAAIECIMQGIKVFKYLPERIDLDPLLNMDFNQQVVTDGEYLDFTKTITVDLISNNLISEPFNDAVWKEVWNI
ncbi:hypothetical protein KAR91_39820 [Candidatus Pacearchaeota archaeon]|nr:hypothetical protein [Candidatus Pacearchaeota archaeon]